MRVHTDRQAAAETGALGARAFTIGPDISFAPGRYSPSSPEGERLIAHELTHVVQQRSEAPGGGVPPGATHSTAEGEAAAVSARVARGLPAGSIAAVAPRAVQRQPEAGAPEPDDRLAAAPAPAGATWSPSSLGSFSILVESSQTQPGGSSGSASSGVGMFPLSNRGRIEHFCATPARYPLQIRFYTDSLARPRPEPFRRPAVSVAIDFTPSGGAPRRVANVADPSPRYVGAGWPLAPAFGELFAASSSQSGLLSVQARLHDPESATSVAYRDAVPCELVPCA